MTWKLNYNNIGTVEFLLDKENNYYFLEINARIQVEHAVTEMITDIDLVNVVINIIAEYVKLFLEGEALNGTENKLSFKKKD